MIKTIFDGFYAATPSMVVNNSKEVIEFYKKTFNAKERYQMSISDGKTMHAMIRLAIPLS